MRLDPAKSSPGTLSEGDGNRGPKRRDGTREHLARHSHIHQRAEQHVPRNAGGKVEVEDAHGNGEF